MRTVLITVFVFLGFLSTAQKHPVIEYESDENVKKNSLRFIVLGDWGRNGEDNQKVVSRKMGVVAKKFKADFIISTGDNFYPNGVRSTTDHNWLASYENIYTAQSLQTDWYPVLGNHDYRGNPQAEIDYSLIDRKWNMPGRYYSKIFFIDDDTTKGVLIVFLDTTPFLSETYLNAKFNVGGQDTAVQKLWLEQTLSQTPKNILWKIVVGHHPVYTGGGRMKALETQEMKKLFEPIFKKYGVNAYICGHDHNLQYIKPAGNTHYFVSGAGAELSRTIVHPEGGVFVRAENGFMNMSVSAKEMHISFVNDKAQTIYSKTILHP